MWSKDAVGVLFEIAMPLAEASLLVLFAGGAWGLLAVSASGGDSTVLSIDSTDFASVLMKASKSMALVSEGCFRVSSPPLKNRRFMDK
jgi:hypothetical protein